MKSKVTTPFIKSQNKSSISKNHPVVEYTTQVNN